MKPLDLTGYTPKKRNVIKCEQFYCVYAVGRGEGYPIKIGYASDIVHRIGNMQSGLHEPIHVWHLLWFPGRPCAIAVEKKCHEMLKTAGKHKINEWFNVPPEWAKKTINSVARILYPQATIKTHEIMVRTLSMIHPEKNDAWGLDAFPIFNDKQEISIQSRITSPSAKLYSRAPERALEYGERRSGPKSKLEKWGPRITRREARRKRA